jgi:hypothetical protein
MSSAEVELEKNWISKMGPRHRNLKPALGTEEGHRFVWHRGTTVSSEGERRVRWLFKSGVTG